LELVKRKGVDVIELYEIEIEFIKVFILGGFLGWYFRKYFWVNQKVKWVSIKNIKYPIMNKNHKI
jgi:hypothetical protein